MLILLASSGSPVQLNYSSVIVSAVKIYFISKRNSSEKLSFYSPVKTVWARHLSMGVNTGSCWKKRRPSDSILWKKCSAENGWTIGLFAAFPPMFTMLPEKLWCLLITWSMREGLALWEVALLSAWGSTVRTSHCFLICKKEQINVTYTSPLPIQRCFSFCSAFNIIFIASLF